MWIIPIQKCFFLFEMPYSYEVILVARNESVILELMHLEYETVKKIYKEVSE